MLVPNQVWAKSKELPAYQWETYLSHPPSWWDLPCSGSRNRKNFLNLLLCFGPAAESLDSIFGGTKFLLAGFAACFSYACLDLPKRYTGERIHETYASQCHCNSKHIHDTLVNITVAEREHTVKGYSLTWVVSSPTWCS